MLLPSHGKVSDEALKIIAQKVNPQNWKSNKKNKSVSICKVLCQDDLHVCVEACKNKAKRSVRLEQWVYSEDAPSNLAMAKNGTLFYTRNDLIDDAKSQYLADNNLDAKSIVGYQNMHYSFYELPNSERHFDLVSKAIETAKTDERHRRIEIELEASMQRHRRNEIDTEASMQLHHKMAVRCDQHESRICKTETTLEDQGARLVKTETTLEDQGARLGKTEASLNHHGARLGKTEDTLNNLQEQNNRQEKTIKFLISTIKKEVPPAVAFKEEELPRETIDFDVADDFIDEDDEPHHIPITPMPTGMNNPGNNLTSTPAPPRRPLVVPPATKYTTPAPARPPLISMSSAQVRQRETNEEVLKADKIHANTNKSALSQEEEKVALVYRKMLKLKFSSDVVRHKMEREKVDQKIVIAVLGQGETNEEVRNRRNIKPGLHWNALPSGQKLTKSIWAKSTGGTEQQEISKHIELFQKKKIAFPTATQPKKSQNGGNDKPMAELIGLKRANNVSISLKAFKDFSNKELSNVIEFIDPLNKLHGDLVSFLSSILPTALELNAIEDYKGSDDALVPAERWFKQISQVKRAEEKVGVLIKIETFKNEADELTKSFQQLIDVCLQVMNSQKLHDLLVTIREIGNQLNKGYSEAAGFKLDFLPRLARTKFEDKKKTVMDLMVTIFLARGQREGLMLSSDFPECQKASRIFLSNLTGDVEALAIALKKCTQELDSLRKDGGQNKVSPTDTNDDGSRPSDYNLGSATKRVQKFLIETKSIFADLEAKRDEAIEACNGLSELFGETGGEQAASTLLGILAEFAGNLDRAVKRHDEQQKFEDRKQRAVLKRKGTGAAQNNEAVGEKKTMPPGEKSGKMPRNPLY